MIALTPVTSNFRFNGYIRHMNPPRPDPFLIAEEPALDFVNSVCAPWGDEIEWIGDPQDLLDWLDHAGLNHVAQVTDQTAAQARTLREWFRGILTEHAADGFSRLTQADLAPLNTLLARNPMQTQVSTEGRLSLSVTPVKTPDAALAPIAHAIAHFLTHADPKRVRQCEGASCTLWFRDTSKSNRRRWCSMAVCGNRAKVAGFRARQRGQA